MMRTGTRMRYEFAVLVLRLEEIREGYRLVRSMLEALVFAIHADADTNEIDFKR
jgi:hypothetical protein